MPDTNLNQLKADLANVLRKHGVQISFTCSACSDTYGLCDDKLVIETESGELLLDPECDWVLTASDLEEPTNGNT